MEAKIGRERNQNEETISPQEGWLPAGARTKADVLLWIAQGLLLALFLLAGGMKAIRVEAVTNQMVLPGLFMKFN
jgi:hypothetical protein